MFGIDDAALAAILSGALSTAGALYTNSKNRKAEADANAINWDIARTNNATQIEMANTAHQREVRDLRMAGLNPILSAGGNGSSTPTLQGATMNPVHTNSDLFEGLANSAKGLSRYIGEDAKFQAKQQKAQSELSDLQLEHLRNTQALRLAADHNDAEADFYRSQVEKDATERFTGLSDFSANRDKHGDWIQAHMQSRPDKYDDAVRKELKALEADQRIRKSRDVLSIFPFLNSGVNSAGGLMRSK